MRFAIKLLPLLVASAAALTAPGKRSSNSSSSSSIRTSASYGAVVVDKSGLHSNYTTVQAGVDALSATETGLQNLFIYPGVYTEQVVRASH